MRRLLFGSAILAGWLWLSGCVAQATPSPQAMAREALIRYFDLLHDGSFQEAAALYGGPYDALVSWNPELNPSDHAALVRSGCTRNGLQCQEVLEATLAEGSSETRFIFEVKFKNDDGSLFVRGPCCGATATEQPPQDVFSG